MRNFWNLEKKEDFKFLASRLYKNSFILNSTEDEIYPANKY